MKAAERIRPKLHVFGHIHGGSGTATPDGIRFVNASVLDEQYGIAHDLRSLRSHIEEMLRCSPSGRQAIVILDDLFVPRIIQTRYIVLA
jgi:hypothetical protein